MKNLFLILYFAFFIFHSSPLLHARVLFGIDVLQKEKFQTLKGAKVGLITNHTGVDHRGRRTVDILDKTPHVELVAILSPEHGFSGTIEHGQTIEDGKESVTHIPIYSLYGQTTRPTEEMLSGIDTLVFDIQDVGTRFYTYIATMGKALEEAARKNIRFVVLDRPNPLGGEVVEGDILDRDIRRMTGYYSLPTRHGLTVGEMAHWYNQTQGLKAEVEVVKLKRWKRHYLWDQTGQPFISPSPNIKNPTTALLYSGIGCFEATNVSVGRGTDTPFFIFGAPWLNGKALVAHLRAQNLSGVLFEPVEYVPTKDLYKGQPCKGVRVIVTNRYDIKPYDIFVESFLFIFDRYPQFEPLWEEVRVMTGSNKLQDAAFGTLSLENLYRHYDQRKEEFLEHISHYYLYD